MQYATTIDEILRLESSITAGNRALLAAGVTSVRYQYVGQLSVSSVQRIIDNDPSYEDTVAGRLTNQLAQAQAADREIQARLRQLGLAPRTAGQPNMGLLLAAIGGLLLLASQ